MGGEYCAKRYFEPGDGYGRLDLVETAFWHAFFALLHVLFSRTFRGSGINELDGSEAEN